MFRLAVEGFEFYSRQTRTRFPFRYGIASMTEVPHLFVRARIRVDDREALGLASEGLPPKWFTKDPSTTFDQDLPAMLGVIAGAARFMTEAGRRPVSFFELWRETYGAQAAWAAHTGTPALLANLGVSLCERAVLDGLCRAARQTLHRLVLGNRLGLRLGILHPDLGSAEPRDLLPDRPLDTFLIRHTVGLSDPLTAEEVPEADRVDDGLPQDLRDCVRAYGLRAFKVKLSGDTARDVTRLRGLQQLLAELIPDGSYLVTLDGNENFRGFGLFRAFWEQLTSEPAVAEILARTRVVEQPVHRDEALRDEVREVLGVWRDRPSLIIDESDGALEDTPRALAVGYDGTSHKNCKGIVKGIANACLLEHLRRQGRRVILTGEDLCNLGPVALLQDLAVMTLLGVPHVERNGHHYFRGLTPWPESWQAAALADHPDLYTRDPRGFVRVAIREGKAAVASVNAAPFGLAPLLDPSGFGKADLQ